MESAPDSAPDYGGYEYAADAKSASVEEVAAAPADYDYGMDMAEAEAPSAEPSAAAPSPAATGTISADGEGGGAMGAVAFADDAPAPSAAPSPGGGSRSSSAKKDSSSGSSGRAKGGKVARDEAPVEAERARESKTKLAKPVDRNIQSGTLTAGSFDDNLNPWVFDKFVDQARSHPDLARIGAAFAGQHTVLRVQDKNGRPIGNAKVNIDGKQMMTRSDGRVVWVEGWDSGRQGQGKATIEVGNSRKTVAIKDQIEQMVVMDDAAGTLPTRLDIALVIDATGSMGDELEYLKVEIRDIAEAIAHHFPNVDQRYALVVYRDDGDQYVTRTFDFTGDLDAFQADLADQSANGGGDYPEAMDKAMEATAKLSWRGGETARVTFLVADAPPHANDFDDTLDAVDDLRAKGVAVYPVASSGVAGEAEFMMRAAAMLTGAQYLFLTDDSGVGNPHAEPHIPCYTVEQLAPLMVRAVRSELSGKRVEAEQQFSIRTVGQGQGGVCEAPRKSAKLAR